MRASPSGRRVDLLAALGQPLLDRLAGALQGAVDRGHRGLERLADLLGGEAEHLAQDQHRPLARRQVLHRGDEGELDRLALLVAGVGGGVAVLDLERLVGVGLEPDLLGRPARPAAGSGRPAGPYSTGSSRFLRRAIRSRLALVAIR